MTVTNPFSRRTPEREEVLRVTAVVGALAGVGAAASLFALDSRDAVITLGLLASLALGFALAGRVWLMRGWRASHTSYALAAGANWMLVGFLLPPTAGAIPLVLGAALVGTGLAGLATGYLVASTASRV